MENLIKEIRIRITKIREHINGSYSDTFHDRQRLEKLEELVDALDGGYYS